jgi:hypothetical protein
MKILLFKNGCGHHKNTNALQKYKNIEFTYVDSMDNISNLYEYDCVISIGHPIDVSKYPTTLFLFGPQFSVFPDERLNCIKGENSYYNLLSDWVINYWSPYKLAENIHPIKMPFGVETDTFTEIVPIQQRTKVLLYYKHRDYNELNFLTDFLNSKHIEYTLFGYDQRYNEWDYLSCLQQSKYAVILDAHESQGFAIQEAMSCNVPLFVWNVRSMNQEYGQHYTDIPATTIPYWDERCGEFFYNREEIEESFQLFLSKLETYHPRQYILDTLSMEVCEKRLMDFVDTHKISSS